MVDPPFSVTCPRCGRTSYHPEDFIHRYCGACHLYHDDMFPVVLSVGTITHTIGELDNQPGYLGRLSELLAAAAEEFHIQDAAARLDEQSGPGE